MKIGQVYVSGMSKLTLLLSAAYMSQTLLVWQTHNVSIKYGILYGFKVYLTSEHN